MVEIWSLSKVLEENDLRVKDSSAPVCLHNADAFAIHTIFHRHIHSPGSQKALLLKSHSQ